ncbi:putative superfamily III holin-X [Nicoletella semolina]|uniref:Putative superfamily III holin-X n=1 Tax=Nicoletella semolina TaxID=271160 RepID=A0A4R2N9X9_9PAST|nr:phage holin family protein [Nicoletella semolina]MDH2925392.1 hypothetical protein [Nicoletella semolina]TCP17871.1 putative superfamily III holin-X [Nicoletella semolina]
MLPVKQIKNSIKNTVVTVLELAHVRLDMARIELVQQKNYLITTLIAVFVIFVSLLVAFLSLLFGLHSVLDPEMQKIVFFSISGGAMLVCLLMGIIILRSLKKQSHFMTQTLNEIRSDIIAIKSTLETPLERE